MSPVRTRRTDSVKAAIVEKGIQLQDRVGTELAAHYLKSHNVGLEVGLRALNRPKERRHHN
jgi:hypothetical protein